MENKKIAITITILICITFVLTLITTFAFVLVLLGKANSVLLLEIVTLIDLSTMASGAGLLITNKSV